MCRGVSALSFWTLSRQECRSKYSSAFTHWDTHLHQERNIEPRPPILQHCLFSPAYQFYRTAHLAPPTNSTLQPVKSCPPTLHHSLFSPAYQFYRTAHLAPPTNSVQPCPTIHTRSVNNERQTQDTNDKKGSEDKKNAVQCQVVEKQSLYCLPSDPNIKKEWINFIFKELVHRKI